MIQTYIQELSAYGLRTGLVAPEDRIYTINRLLELFRLDEFTDPDISGCKERTLCEILEDMTAYAADCGILAENTSASRDLFDTRIMGLLTPPPSAVRRKFAELYQTSPESASNFYYQFSQDTNYIRRDRIVRDEKWQTDTNFGTIDITINLSKPEKDPRDIARAGLAKKSGYPSCLLCKENEGYAGTFTHPARQNHRIVPVTLSGESYFLQYSPYVYYNEHCIIFNEKHIPMKIDRAVFEKLLDFVRQFPHYTAGSNADLPIVGGSILSHDHFQGGRYTFPMARAPIEIPVVLHGYEDISAGIVNWPLSVIRLTGSDPTRIAKAGEHILTSWRAYSDPAAFIYAETEGIPHNTITPIARRRDGNFELDLVLRCNITTEEHPMGLFHPHEQYHHIKKENIGLIEVMGLAILPARLKTEFSILETAILNGSDLHRDPATAIHADWADSWKSTCPLTAENIHEVLQREVGKTFAKILECSGVYKCTPEGREAFLRFIHSL